MQSSTVVEVSPDSLYLRPRENWAQWVLPEEQRDKAVHAQVQAMIDANAAAAAAVSAAAAQAAQAAVAATDKPAAAALAASAENNAVEPATPVGDAPAAAEAILAAAPVREASEDKAAASEVAVPAAAAAEPTTEPAAAAKPGPNDDEELNEDDMFQLDEVSRGARWVSVSRDTAPPPWLLLSTRGARVAAGASRFLSLPMYVCAQNLPSGRSMRWRRKSRRPHAARRHRPCPQSPCQTRTYRS